MAKRPSSVSIENERVCNFGCSFFSILKGVFITVFVVFFVVGFVFAYSVLTTHGTDSELHGAAEIATSFDFGNANFEVFVDVPFDHENAYALSFLKSRGMIFGFDDGTFRPDDKMSRAVFMKMLSEVLNLHPYRLRYEYCYSDVNDEWFAPFVCFGKSRGWFNENESSVFEPSKNITRSDGLAIAINAFGVELLEDGITGFDDVSKSDWFWSYVITAEDAGLLRGLYDDFEFVPNAEMSRAETVELLFRVMVLELPTL